MDGTRGAVMNKIKALGPNGRYFIISAEEFLEEFPEGAERSREELQRALSALAAGGYIEIKYSSGDMYCVAAVRNYSEPDPAPAAPVKTAAADGKRADTPRLTAFWAAFAGGVAGGILTALLCLLFLLC